MIDHDSHEATPVTREAWPPTPFMAQPRAISALRHELDAIIDELKQSVERNRHDQPERAFELIVLPNRVVARMDDVAISFSWVAGRSPVVSDGCLMVIEWRGLALGVKGIAALKSATPAGEQSYLAEGASSDEWRWRGDNVADQAFTSRTLTTAWMARADAARAA